MLYDDAGTCDLAYASEDLRWRTASGFIFQLADGSFFILDSGWGVVDGFQQGREFRSHVPVFLNALKKYAPDPEHIKVACWFLTHGHQDHAGIFSEIMTTPAYKQFFEIDKVIYSLCPKTVNAFKVEAPNLVNEVGIFEKALKVLRDEGKTELVKTHAGQQFDIKDLDLTILAAPENVLYSINSNDAAGKRFTDIDNYNNACTISVVTYKGKNILFLGDASLDEIFSTTPHMLSYIKSLPNISVQAAHHGYADTRAHLIYRELSNIDIAFFTTCHEHYTGKAVEGWDYNALLENPITPASEVDFNVTHLIEKASQVVYPEFNKSQVCTDFNIWAFEGVDFLDSVQDAVEVIGDAYKNKWISVFGDSISTWEGISNNAELNSTLSAFNAHYPRAEEEDPATFAPVDELNKLYWDQVITALGAQLCVCNAASADALKSGKFYDRAQNLHRDTGERPEAVIIYYGVNDAYKGQTLGGYLEAQIAQIKAAGGSEADILAAVDTWYSNAKLTFDRNNCAQATFDIMYATLLQTIKTTYSGVELICVSQIETNCADTDISTLRSYNKVLPYIVKYFGGTYVNMSKLINRSNSTYCMNTPGDLHPNAVGHRLMAEEIIRSISKNFIA
jgi:lysophospholipase L1-like esterase